MKNAVKNVGKFLGCIWPMACAFLIQIVVAFVGSFLGGIVFGILSASKGLSGMEAEDYLMGMITSSDFLLLITVVATFGTLVMAVLWYRGHKPASDLSLPKVFNGTLLAAMVLFGISLQCLISMCLNLLYPVLPQNMAEEYSALMGTLIGGNVFLSLLATVVLAPLAEEFIFRGIIQKKAEKFLPFLWANVLQALLFGIYHGNLIQGAYAFLLGLILGFTAKYFRSIWASVLLHACVNGSAELLSKLPETVTETIVGVIGIAIVGMVLLFVAVKLYPKARVAEETSTDNTEM